MRSHFAEAAMIQVLTIVFVGITGLCSPKREWWVGKDWWTKRNFSLVEKTSIRLQYSVRHHPKDTDHKFERADCM